MPPGPQVHQVQPALIYNGLTCDPMVELVLAVYMLSFPPLGTPQQVIPWRFLTLKVSRPCTRAGKQGSSCAVI